MRRSITLATLALFFIPFLSGCMKTQTDFAKRHDVQQFINHLSTKYGFQKEALNDLFNQVHVRTEVVKLIKKPLEKQTWRKYQSLLVSSWRIQNGVKFWNQYEETLQRAERQFGVPPSIVIATLGVETRYGKNMGNYRVFDSLSNLAFNHAPRARYFQQELEEFLVLSRANHFNPLTIKGSYAGAIGQPQFMPSSYRYYAINFSRGNGVIDLTHDTIDVIGSVANYYHKKGWVPGGHIASPVRDARLYQQLAQLKNQKKSIAEWRKLGIHALPTQSDQEIATLIELDNRDSKEYWLGYRNFDIIKRYNPNNLYAMAVFQLSRYIEELKGSTQHSMPQEKQDAT